ncbi:MAG: hypothetical protein EBV14_01470 [Actinobacteria bacterium]|nr:hypothetical protein [Actinomycetota bacterium]
MESNIPNHGAPDAYCRLTVRYSYDLTLLRNGLHDPTTRVVTSIHRGSPAACVERATLTPFGPGSIRIHIDHEGRLSSTAWGTGADWLQSRVNRLTFLLLPASDSPYHELLPAILGQRITAAQALQQWSALCRTYGEPAPGPLGLYLPPTPQRLSAITSWEFHRLGIEEQRARTLHTAARYASYVDRTRDLEGLPARDALMRLPGIGVWTAAVTIGVSHGDPDALPVGDFHVKNTVSAGASYACWSDAASQLPDLPRDVGCLTSRVSSSPTAPSSFA